MWDFVNIFAILIIIIGVIMLIIAPYVIFINPFSYLIGIFVIAIGILIISVNYYTRRVVFRIFYREKTIQPSVAVDADSIQIRKTANGYYELNADGGESVMTFKSMRRRSDGLYILSNMVRGQIKGVQIPKKKRASIVITVQDPEILG